MALEQRQGDLHEDFPNEVFVDALTLLFTFGNQLGKIAAFAVFHHDVEGGLLLIDDLVKAPDDVFVLELPQDVHFVDQLMYLLLPQLAVIDLLPNHLLSCG